MKKKKVLNCPICKEPAVLDKDKNPYLPFCSERCRTIDLGAWLDEKYVIESDESFFDSEQ
ncbi:MAG: DNA gyrase inhibitor YacG [Nitrospinota bacterium]